MSFATDAIRNTVIAGHVGTGKTTCLKTSFSLREKFQKSKQLKTEGL
jgi:Flp pilus assembly CpaF family ATPase